MMDRDRDSYWDLMADMARLQSQLGEDLTAWARMYEAGGQALQGSGRTLGQMAELGRRMEQYLQSGPPAVVTQILRMLTSPWPGLGVGGMPPATSTASGPFGQMFEAWLGGTPPQPPPAAKPAREGG